MRIKMVGAFNATTKDYQFIPMGTPDPFIFDQKGLMEGLGL